MTSLLVVMAASLLMAGLIQYRDRLLSFRFGRNRKEKAVTVLLILRLGGFCGLRDWYNDTVTYLQIFDQTGTPAQAAAGDSFDLAHGLGFQYLTAVLKGGGLSSQDYLMFYALLTLLFYLIFLRSYSDEDFVFCLFLFFMTGSYIFTMAAIKQCMAMGLCMIAVLFALKKKWLPYLLFIAAAMLFHPYAIVYLVVPLMMYRPWQGTRTWLLIGGCVVAGLLLEELLGTVVDITTMMGASYSLEELTGEGVNIFRVLVCCVPIPLSWLYSKRLFEDSSPKENLMVNLAMANGMIMFIGLFGTANYFARLANYFLIFQSLSLAWMLKKIGGKEGKVLKLLCVIGYIGYFYYENVALRSFDASFSRISLMEYFKVSSVF